MASSSSSSFHIKRYHIFLSFHGRDVRRAFLSHLHNHFASKGITTFKDQEIERGNSIGPELVKAIRESRVSIVLLSKNYASSSWCLDELVEIFKCKEDQDQIVMTVFYDVNPSDVRKQRGYFGSNFEKTCEGKTEQVKQKWSKVLTDVANIEGEHSLNWANEADMIKKIATDVSKKLNISPSRDFEGMVGLEAHLTRLDSLLRLECDEVKMIGIWGPAGIGKTTIARALLNQLSTEFPLSCFIRTIGVVVDDYDSKLSLQSKLLSKILDQRDMRVHHLGAIKEWLHDQRVLIILDDVDDLEQLKALANETSWFGPGSRIIVTTKDKKILKAHEINDIYLVEFPSEEDALEILYLFAFKQSSSVQDGFEDLAKKVVKLCGNLPLGLRVVGSSLCGESEDEWRLQLYGLETNLDRKIEDVLRVGYDKLLEKHQSLFLHIACFFNNNKVDHVTTILADSNLDVRNGLKTLVVKSLVHISTRGRIVMHNLLQQLGRQIVLKQSNEPGKRQFLVQGEDIRDLLENETGTGSVIGISSDMSKVGEFSITGRAFEGMRNLKYLRFNNANVSLLEDIEYLPRLRFLHWPLYPRKCLPPTFHPERLVELHMPNSNLEKLWGGIQPLTSLKKIDLGYSLSLKEIPNLSKATNLETLIFTGCESLVEVPSSMSNLHKLEQLEASGCINLQVVSTNINLESLEEVNMIGCSRLRNLPYLSRNIKTLRVGGSMMEDFPLSVVGDWSLLDSLQLGSRSLKRLTHVPENVTSLDLSNSDIKTIPDCVITLPHLRMLIIANCDKLVSIPGHPASLELLVANHCVSLKRVCFSLHNRIRELDFYNCLKLDEEARRRIIQQYCKTLYQDICLPGKQVPVEFTHKAKGNAITIPVAPGTISVSTRVKVCLVLSPIKDKDQINGTVLLTCCLRRKEGVQINSIEKLAWVSNLSPESPSEHLFIFCRDLVRKRKRYHEVDVTTSEILFEFRCWEDGEKIIECGVQILREEAESSSGI